MSFNFLGNFIIFQKQVMHQPDFDVCLKLHVLLPYALVSTKLSENDYPPPLQKERKIIHMHVNFKGICVYFL